MKNVLPLCAGLVLWTTAIQAGPLQQHQIAADAKWVAHVDVDKLRQSKLGEHFGTEFLDKQLAKPVAKLQKDLGVDFDWRKIHSITAYGWSFKGKDVDGVLLIKSDLDLPAMIDSALAKFGQAGGAAEAPVQKSEENETTIYEMRGEAFGAASKSGGFVITRTKDRLQAALKTASGPAGKSAGSKLAGLGDRDAFLMFGVAADFSEFGDLPKQAQVLQQAEGARLTAGEKAENVFVTLSLDTRTVEAATQIQQLAQGLIALGNLNGDQNADLQKLAQAARVESKEKVVTLALQMPVQDVITRIDEVHTKKSKAKARQ